MAFLMASAVITGLSVLLSASMLLALALLVSLALLIVLGVFPMLGFVVCSAFALDAAATACRHWRSYVHVVGPNLSGIRPLVARSLPAPTPQLVPRTLGGAFLPSVLLGQVRRLP